MTKLFYNAINRSSLANEMRVLLGDLRFLGIHQQYQNCCLFMSSLLCEILRARGYQARIQACYAVIDRSDQRFLLGYKGYAKPGQIEGHVVCIVEESYLIDFATGNVRKYFDPRFKQAFACAIEKKENLLAQVNLQNGTQIHWHEDLQALYIEAAIDHQTAALQQVLIEYFQYKKAPLRHCLRRAFHALQLQNRSARSPHLSSSLN